MNFPYFVIFFISSLCLTPILSAEKFTLNLVQVLFRHGERTPVEEELSLLGNLTEDSFKPYEKAQLTAEGKRQEYRIGKLLREKYGKFLGEAYKPSEVYAYSSNTDRTKESLALALAGLFPVSPKLKWSKDLNWSPIPIHTVPRPLDVLIRPEVGCSKYMKELSELSSNRKILERKSKIQDLIDILEEYYKKKIEFEDIFFINNIIKAHKNFNLTYPSWYSENLKKKLADGSRLYLDTLSYTPSLTRMNGGPLVKRFIENMNILNKYDNPRKIYLYSGHEYDLYKFAKAHNVRLPGDGIPTFGSAIILEQYRGIKGHVYLRMLFWTGAASKELVVLKLDSCTYYDTFCTFSEYYAQIKNIIPSKEEEQCQYEGLDKEKLLSYLNDDFVYRHKKF